MKKLTPYLIALVFTILVYLTIAWGLVDTINHIIILISTLFFAMAIAGFYSSKMLKAFSISIIFYSFGIFVLYYGFYTQSSWELFRALSFTIYFLLSSVGIFLGIKYGRNINKDTKALK
jgi:hypothetical protein